MEWVNRPWGDYQVLEARPGVKIKLIRVKPGGKTSLQRHQHRKEHWTVVDGVMTVTVDDGKRSCAPAAAGTPTAAASSSAVSGRTKMRRAGMKGSPCGR